MEKITLDTSVLPVDHSLLKNKPVEVAIVSVTGRELKDYKKLSEELKKIESIEETLVFGESNWGQGKWAPIIYETAIIGESKVGDSLVGAEDEKSVFEKLLKIISSGSFPKLGERDNLNKGERHQLRDAMILEAHIRDNRDIFVTKDVKGFIGRGERKEKIRKEIEKRFEIRIMSMQEFINYLSKLKTQKN